MTRLALCAALAAALTLPALSASLDIGGNTYYVYAKADWQGTQTSSQVVFLDAICVQDGREVPLNATGQWGAVKDCIADGGLKASLWENQTWSASHDTVEDGDAVYVVSDRDSLLTTRYRALRSVGTKGALRPDVLPDSVAASIANDSLSVAPTLRRLRSAMGEFLGRWAVPDTMRMSRRKYEELTR